MIPITYSLNTLKVLEDVLIMILLSISLSAKLPVFFTNDLKFQSFGIQGVFANEPWRVKAFVTCSSSTLPGKYLKNITSTEFANPTQFTYNFENICTNPTDTIVKASRTVYIRHSALSKLGIIRFKCGAFYDKGRTNKLYVVSCMPEKSFTIPLPGTGPPTPPGSTGPPGPPMPLGTEVPLIPLNEDDDEPPMLPLSIVSEDVVDVVDPALEVSQ